MRCRKCRADLPERKPGAGRPAVYCSAGCRRAAEYELRRLQHALEGVEDQARRYRTGGYGRPREAPEHIEAERLRLEERLRELLDTTEEAA